MKEHFPQLTTPTRGYHNDGPLHGETRRLTLDGTLEDCNAHKNKLPIYHSWSAISFSSSERMPTNTYMYRMYANAVRSLLTEWCVATGQWFLPRP
jgi:hypothetical protein